MAPAGENNVPTNRLPYNSRQRQPSTDSETSTISDIQQMDGPGANEYKFVEHNHPNQVQYLFFKDFFLVYACYKSFSHRI